MGQKFLIIYIVRENLKNIFDNFNESTLALKYPKMRKFKNRQHETPIVIFLDLKMPKMDGLEVVKQIKTDENMKNIPVVMVTSSREEKDLVESYGLGVNAYVVKPVDFDEFIETIKQLGIFWTLINEAPI